MDVIAERAYPTPLANSALLPMLLLSLASQKHTPDTTDAIDEEYDYIIVGTGSAGSVVASRLSEMSCLKILLLEAGDSPPLMTDVPALAKYFRGTDIDWNFKTVPQKHTGDGLTNRQLVYPSGKAVGGSSVLNGMLYIRGNSKDYDQWAAEGAKGWSYKDVFPFFKKMEGNRDKNYIANGFHGVDGPMTVHRSRYQAELMDPLFKTIKSMGYKVIDPNSGRQTGFYDIQSTLRAGQRCSTAKAYLVPAEKRTNLDILSNAMVRKVLVKNNRAVGVQFDHQNFTYEVKAKREVILSAGTIKTAQLLKLSGIGPRKELERFQIPVIADLPVGFNLQDHPVFHTNFLLGRNVPRVIDKLTDDDNVAEYIRNRTGPLSSTDFASAVAFLKGKVIVPKQDYPDYQLTFAESQYEFPLKAGLTPKYMSQVYGPYKGRSFYVCMSSLLHPKSRGTVMLQSTDPYDPPLIDPNYFEDPKDVQGIIEGVKMCLRIGKNPLMRNVGSVPFQTLVPGCEKHAENEDSYLECAVRSAVFTFSHAVGTARMGDPKDPKTVVDPQLKVLHISNLRVVDPSIMPTITSGNTNIPTIMVAEKASDIIKSTIECLDKQTDLKKKSVNPKRSGRMLENPPQSYTRKQNKHEPLSQEASITRSSKPRFFPAHSPKDVHDLHDEGDWEDKPPVTKWKKVLPKVTPWNKEIPNVVPWNQEIMKVNLLNVGVNQTLPGNINSLLPGIQQIIPGLPGLPNNLASTIQQIIPGLPGLPNNPVPANQQRTPTLSQLQASLSSEQSRTPAHLPQYQAPNNPSQTQLPNNPLQAETPVNPLPSQMTDTASQIPGVTAQMQTQMLINLLQDQMPMSNLQFQNLVNALQTQTPTNKLQAQIPVNALQAQAPDNSVSSRSLLNSPHSQSNTLLHIGKTFTGTQTPVGPIQIKEKIDHIMQQLLNPSNQLTSSGKLEYSPFQKTQINLPHKNEEKHLINLSSRGPLTGLLTHTHKHVLPWNKEVPNVVPWNQEILASNILLPSTGNHQVPQISPNNPPQVLPTNPLINQQSQTTNAANSPQSQAPTTSQQGQATQPQAPATSQLAQPQNNLQSQTGNSQGVMQYLMQLQQTLQSQIPLLASRQQLMQNLLEIVQQMINLFSPNSPLTPPNRRTVENSETPEQLNERQCDKEICNALLQNMRCTHVSCHDKKALSVFMHSQLCS